ncbi:hypothetical protein EV174_002291 [Coemansia sp. RSA 2320]|nr:hypothetical protein EV174_002291 [Coemansia sp. RSA 2320]
MSFNGISVGIEPWQAVADADDYVFKGMTQAEADFCVLAVTHLSGLDAQAAVDRGHFELSEVVTKSAQNTYCVLGKQTDWTNEALASMEAQYAAYVGIRRVLAPEIGGSSGAEYARLLLSLMADSAAAAVVARVRLAGGSSDHDDIAWRQWNALRQRCAHHPRLQVALELPEAPDSDVCAARMRQWQAEPVVLVVLPTTLFVRNAAGYPVLRAAFQAAVRRWMDFSVALAVRQSHGDNSALVDYVRYVRHLGAALGPRDAAADASDAYRDVLQAPLQPLMDHLDAVTYETFEQDVPKYDAYERAVALALSDAKRKRGASELVVAVVGAGRGPLVTRVRRAASGVGVRVRVVAVEKNPRAFVELQRRNAGEWAQQVELVLADMRRWAPAQRVDVLVSELLGSFADNELAPECLADAHRLLAPGGVCIPQRCSAYVAPLSSAVLHARAAANAASAGKDAAPGLETPYVVNLHAAHVLADARAVWSFDFPAGSPRDCAATAEFRVPCASLVHGLAGFFDAVLYKDVVLSICPAAPTADMHSWFPMFFPVKLPMAVRAGDEVTVHMWRRTANARTWYEWALATPTDASLIHNISGHEFWIGH